MSLLFNLLSMLVITFLPRSSSVQFSSVAQSCLILCNPMNHSTQGLPVHHHLPESTQTHVHRVGDAIQPSHPLLSPLPPAPNLSQHQGLFNESTLCMRWPSTGVSALASFLRCLLISWLQSPSAVILEPQKNKVSHCFHCFPIYFP